MHDNNVGNVARQTANDLRASHFTLGNSCKNYENKFQ